MKKHRKKPRIQRYYNDDAAEFLRRVRVQKTQEKELEEMDKTFLVPDEIEHGCDLSLYYDKQ